MFKKLASMRCIWVLAVGGTALFLLGLAVLVPVASAQQGRTLAILLPGKVGAVAEEFLIRNRATIGAGVETRVTLSPDEAANIARAEKQKGRKVVLVGFSLGARRIAKALAAGAPADGVVLVSGVLGAAMSELGSAAKLPATLVVHHRNDTCEQTRPASVGAFQQWAGGRARVVWIDTQQGSGPPPAGAKKSLLDDPCGPFRAHGFYMQDSQAVAAIVSFIRSR